MAARLEHASVAAFARFQLQLLALGAPANLVQGAAEAMMDEIRHTQKGFALASGYLGEALSPGPLDLSGVFSKGDAADALREAVLEGCVGETCAALEAEHAYAAATDPSVRAALSEIAEDERQHALLAWRFVGWLLAAKPALSDVALAVLRESKRWGEEDGASPGETEAVGGDTTLERQTVSTNAAHGVLPRRFRLQLRADVVRQVVEPALLALVNSVKVDSRRAAEQWMRQGLSSCGTGSGAAHEAPRAS
jgi:hypothetical protein